MRIRRIGISAAFAAGIAALPPSTASARTRSRRVRVDADFGRGDPARDLPDLMPRRISLATSA
jgi:hypothetical protein